MAYFVACLCWFQDETIFPTLRNLARYESFVGGLKNRLTELPGGKVKHQLIKMLEHLGVNTFHKFEICVKCFESDEILLQLFFK